MSSTSIEPAPDSGEPGFGRTAGSLLLLIEGAAAAVVAAFMISGSVPVAGIVAALIAAVSAVSLLCSRF